MNKNLIAVLVVVAVALGIWYWTSMGTEVNTGGMQARAGEHCGGNITTARSCVSGYHCAPEPGSHLPFGDVGGICVTD